MSSASVDQVEIDGLPAVVLRPAESVVSRGVALWLPAFTRWALDELTDGPVVVGGHSMGGDIAVALAGVDARVSRVAATVSTPDWLRPGMRSFANPDEVVQQGVADSYAEWFYMQLDPITHLDAYERGPAITFECGADDTHVPPDGAIRFREMFDAAYPKLAGRIRVNLHVNCGHTNGGDPQCFNACTEWLAAAD